jgi:YidC/Oxa1 family membrane protein insertase
MDRRTLLAFLLIFIVIWVYQLMTFRDVQNRPSTQQADTAAVDQEREGFFAEDTTDTRPAADSAPDDSWRTFDQPQVTALTALEPADLDILERTITVKTPLYEIELSGRGARVTSWRGFEYADHRGVPVQLIPQGEHAVAHGADEFVFAGQVFDLGRRIFATDEPARIELSQGTRRVVFRYRTAGDLEFRKIYTFDADSYEIVMDLELAAAGPQASAAQTILGPPRAVRFGWGQGIAMTETGDRLEEAAFRAFAGVGEGLDFRKRGGQIRSVEKVQGSFEGTLRFAGVQNKYFTIVGMPWQGETPAPSAEVALSGDPERNIQTWAVKLPVQEGYGGSGAIAGRRLDLYIGPQETDLLRSYGVGLEKTMEMGWALFRPLTEATLWIMSQMRRFIPNYGVIIILFSVLTKIAFYPLTRTSTRSMKRMQQLQPKIKELQEKYKENREKQSQEMMKLYKKEKINPMAGCLPLLLQMPVFIALYQALAHTIALRNTPFFAWITDLSKPDALFSFPFSLPLLGSDFNLLPILMTATMVLQMRMTPTGTAPAQMAMMNTVMPVVFLFFFYQMPSGLVLYWLVNNIVTIYQTWRIHKTAIPEGGS